MKEIHEQPDSLTASTREWPMDNVVGLGGLKDHMRLFEMYSDTLCAHALDLWICQMCSTLCVSAFFRI
jgi:hypothetical protein